MSLGGLALDFDFLPITQILEILFREPHDVGMRGPAVLTVIESPAGLYGNRTTVSGNRNQRVNILLPDH
jgi:hypothetical protein